MSFYFNNSNNRTDLDQKVYQGIKFKTQYPTYNDFKTRLKASNSNLTDTLLTEQIYKFLSSMIGNLFLRYSTDTKNDFFISYYYEQLWIKKDRENTLYVKAFEDLLKQTSSATQTMYKVNRTEEDDLDADFVDNIVRNDLVNTTPQIVFMKEYKAFLNMENPLKKFLERLSSIIVAPVQQTDYGKDF